MLNSKQRSYLRGLGNALESIFQVGKGGVNDNLTRQFEEALEAREIVKATVLQNSMVDAREAAETIAEAVGAEVVQVIGKKFVLYKESQKHKTIVLP